MKIGLIAMVVQTCQTGECIQRGTTAKSIFLRSSEDAVQADVKIFTTYLFHKGVGIVRYIESILPGISFLESTPRLVRLKVVNELTIGEFGTNKLQCRIEQMLPPAG